ncbi:unnamed protein product [Discosporangium mesarthrocarpum]
MTILHVRVDSEVLFLYQSSSSERFRFVKEMVAANPIMVFSKSYCPYCTKAKRALSAVGAKYKVLELDQEANGPAIQEALQSITGQRTVPNVFVGGKVSIFVLSSHSTAGVCRRTTRP